jgi:hypothetical protein
MSHLGAWTRSDVMLLHIFILLLIWFVADRSKLYFTDIPRYWYMMKLYVSVWWKEFRASKPTNWAGPR